MTSSRAPAARRKARATGRARSGPPRPARAKSGPARKRRSSPRSARKRTTRGPARKRTGGQKRARRGTATRRTTRKKGARPASPRKGTARKKVTRSKLTRKKTAPRKATGRKAADAGAAKRARELESTVRALESSLAKALREKKEIADQLAKLRARLLQREAEIKRTETHRERGSASAAPPPDDGPLAPPSEVDEHAAFPMDIEADGEPPVDEAEEPDAAVEAESSLGGRTSYDDFDEEEDFLGPDGAIVERRRQLDRERSEREVELGDEPFWMICPRCGEHLSEHEFDGVKIERCEACGAFCFDKGEIDLLMLISESDRSLAYRTRGLLQ